MPTQYTAMPLYLGDIWALLSKSPDIRTKEQIIIQVFEGLSYMHKNQVLHRDLKPDNIFWVTESPVSVKIGDYGLATSLADHHTLFDTCGTAAYMAPKILKGNVPQTTATDVFSLGGTVFAILEHDIVMRGWYKRGHPPQLYNRVFENVAYSPPRLYAGLVQSMMAPNPADRPSLEICIDVSKGSQYQWTKGTQLAPVQNTTPIAAIEHDTSRPANAAKQQQTPLDRARAWAIKRNLQPVAQVGKLENLRDPQQAFVKLDYKLQQDASLLQNPKVPVVQAAVIEAPKPEVPFVQAAVMEAPKPKVPFVQAAVAQAPKPREPAPVQGVNFQDGLPSYEEATSQNPFARLTDSREIAKKRSKKLNKKRISQTLRHSCEQAINIRRAQAAGVHKPREQLERQAARKKRWADLKKGAYYVAKGCYVLCGALLGLTCEELVVGGEKIYRMLNDSPAARKALENAIPSINANEQLMTSMHRHSVKATLSNGFTAGKRQRSFRDYTDQEMVNYQLMLSRRRR